MRRILQNCPASRNQLVSLATLILLAARPSALAQSEPQRLSKAAAPSASVALRAAGALSGHARRIVVSIPDRKLALIEDGRVAKVYRVAVGADVTPSPAGALTIAHRVSQPTYYHPGIVIPAGPDNPLGTRWIGLSTPGYGIHGTNQPRSIGKRASHGCIRMRNRDVEALFERVRVGDAVEIYDERTEEIERLFPAPPAPVQVAARGPVRVESVGAGQ